MRPGNDTVTADRADVLSGCENVSLPAPETSRIDGPKKATKGTKAFFTFAASVASATFECQVDTGAFKPCASPFKVKTKKLKTGKHTLNVRAVQPAGNADPTPSTFTFKVKATNSGVADRALRRGEAVEAEPGLRGQRDGQAGRRADRDQRADAGGDRLLDQLEAGPAAHDQARPRRGTGRRRRARR